MPEHLPLHNIEFTSVTLNERGEIQDQRIHHARQFVESLGNGVDLELIVIPGGSFRMGTPGKQGYDDERPVHHVTVAPFLMGKYLITQEQWRAIRGAPHGRFTGDRLPIERVSGHDAARFCERLSNRTGRAYRLPSEAQWEYACRAGTATPFHFGPTITTEVANYNGEFVYRGEPKGVYRHTTTQVDLFPPNAFGLHDMHGHLWEWCADAWHDSYEGAPVDDRVWQAPGREAYRVARGGSWHDIPDVCRSAARLKVEVHDAEEILGFRIVAPLDLRKE
ncbi:Serine/threonine-protein kinase Pkn1 [Thermoflexales bacterium]|nr:Serine/threonine-protein kinase Pkn1 [Thermoflexales bacterium]